MQSSKLCELQDYAKFETSKHVTKYFKSETYKQKDFMVQSLFEADVDLHMIRSLDFLFQYLFVSAYESFINQLLLGEDDLSSQAHCRTHKTSCFSNGVLIKQSNCGLLKYLEQPLHSSVGAGLLRRDILFVDLGHFFKANSLLLSDTIVTFAFDVREEKWVGHCY